MRGTGRLYGMKIDYSIDERRDPVSLQSPQPNTSPSSYKELGTWPLAITSYNHGVYGMKRAVKQTGSTDCGHHSELLQPLLQIRIKQFLQLLYRRKRNCRKPRLILPHRRPYVTSQIHRYNPDPLYQLKHSLQVSQYLSRYPCQSQPRNPSGRF